MSVPHLFSYAPNIIGNAVAKTDIAFTTPGTVEVVGYSFMLPGKTLKTSGDRLMLRMYAQTAANANTKNIKVRMGGLTGLAVGSYTTVGSNIMCQIALGLIRGATQSSLIGYVFNTFYGTTVQAVNWAVNSLDLDQNYEVAVCLETPTAAGDITLTDFFMDAVLKSP